MVEILPTDRANKESQKREFEQMLIPYPHGWFSYIAWSQQGLVDTEASVVEEIIAERLFF